MPWFPDFVSAIELARRQTRAQGHADPVGRYFAALNRGDSHILERLWPGEVVVHDPWAGEIRGHKQLRDYVRQNKSWMAAHHITTEAIASICAEGRAVAEMLAHLPGSGRREVAWPIAVVAESPDEWSVVFRTYCSLWPVDGRRHLRPPLLEPGQAPLGDVVARYQAGLADGDAEAVVSTFAPDGYYREPIGTHATHRGAEELLPFFTERFSDGGIDLQHCAVTDDGFRCAVEYNAVRWGSRDLQPQAGLGVYERGPDGLLAAARIYDDVEAPAAGG